MAFTQHVLTHADWIASGGWEPEGMAAAGDHVVIACVTDADVLDEKQNITFPAGSVVWASWAPPEHNPAERVNPEVPAVDWRQ